MKATVWVITFEVNDYDQYGHYLDRVFLIKPTVEQLNALGYDGEHLLNNGGRVNDEHVWSTLREWEVGKEFPNFL